MSKKPEFADLFFSKTKDFLDIFLKSQEQRSRDTIKAYRISLSSFYKYVTEDKTQYIMHDVNNKGNRNFGYGVMFYYNKLHVFYHQKEFAERGVDIKGLF